MEPRTMPLFELGDLQDLVNGWLTANEEVERVGDWKPLAEFHSENAAVCNRQTLNA
jgi:hypothetical protein